jgi:hypothetical protein
MDAKSKKLDCQNGNGNFKPCGLFNELFSADSSVEYQNVNQFLKQLPYFDKIKSNALNEFERIRLNLSKTIVLNELRPGLVHWTNRLQTYINEYGLFFKKEDHIQLIKIYLEIIATKNIDLTIVDLCFSILIELLK